MVPPTGKLFIKRLMIFMVSAILLLFLAYGMFGEKGYLQMKKSEAQNQKLRQDIEQVKQENQQMMGEIRSLKTDPKTIERIAREELGMVKPGEIKITTAKPEAKSPSPPTSEPRPAPKPPQ